jgi:flavin-dependent dehydrogenase
MQQQVIIVGGGMVGFSLALMLAKSNIAVKLLEAVKYPNYDDKILPLIIPVLMRVIPLCHVVAYRFIKVRVMGCLTTACHTNFASAYYRARQFW